MIKWPIGQLANPGLKFDPLAKAFGHDILEPQLAKGKQLVEIQDHDDGFQVVSYKKK